MSLEKLPLAVAMGCLVQLFSSDNFSNLECAMETIATACMGAVSNRFATSIKAIMLHQGLGICSGYTFHLEKNVQQIAERMNRFQH
jgi:hypothetical protein